LLAGNGRRTRRKSNTTSDDGSYLETLSVGSVGSAASLESQLSNIIDERGQMDDDGMSVKSTSSIASSKIGGRKLKRKLSSGSRGGFGRKRVHRRVNTPLMDSNINIHHDDGDDHVRTQDVDSVVDTVDSATVAQLPVMSVSDIRSKEKEMSTMKKYVGHWRRFHIWLQQAQEFDWIVPDKDPSQLDDLFFSIRVPLSQEIFDAYLSVMMYHRNGKLKHHSTLEGFWASMIHAYDAQKPRLLVSSNLRHKWNQLTVGYKKTRSLKIITDGENVYEGRDSLSRRGYLNLQRLAFCPAKCNPTQMNWVPQMHAASRNLVARISSIGQLTWGTIRWKRDCLCITLPRHKGDTQGERVMERHVHANPLEPLSCFIFWLGVRLLTDPSCGKSHFIFGDDTTWKKGGKGSKSASCKDDAFGRWMKNAICDGRTVEEQIALFDSPGHGLGSHSNRKGQLEELTTSPEGPPPAAALHRSGHKIGKVTEKYVLTMRGGDEFCSRICCGLDMQSLDFSILPPHFTPEVLDATDFSTFVPNYELYEDSFKTAIPFLVASVCYQIQTGWIDQNLHGHPIYYSSFWRHGWGRTLSQAGNISVYRGRCPCCELTATGVPGIVNIASRVHDNTAQLEEFGDKVEDLRTCLIECLGGDDSSTLAHKVTSDVLSQLSSQIDDLGLAMQDSFEKRLTMLDGRVQETIANLQRCNIPTTHVQVASTLPPEQEPPVVDNVTDPPLPPSNDESSYIGTDQYYEWDPIVDDQEEDSKLQHKYNLHPWKRQGINERERLHPTPEPFEFDLGHPILNGIKLLGSGR